MATRRAAIALAAARGGRRSRALLPALGAAAALGATAGATAHCEPIDVHAESAALARASAGKLAGMMSKLNARVFVAPFVDHTLLSATATVADIERLCGEAVQHGFQSVCVNGANVAVAKAALERAGKAADVKVCAVVGFPLGASATPVKAFEAQKAIEDGAVEIDMVINVGRIKSEDWDFVLRDVASVVAVCKDRGAVCKVILETCLLTEAEKAAASKICGLVGADFVKTSTGFSTGGATLADVKLMKESAEGAFSALLPADFKADVQVKASGGIKTAEEARAMLEAGATRIGTSRAAAWCGGDSSSAGAY